MELVVLPSLGLTLADQVTLGRKGISFPPSAHSSWRLAGPGLGLSWETGWTTFLVPREASLPLGAGSPGLGTLQARRHLAGSEAWGSPRGQVTQ